MLSTNDNNHLDEDLLQKLTKGLIPLVEIKQLLEGCSQKLKKYFLEQWADKKWSEENGPEAHRYLTWIVGSLWTPDLDLSTSLGRLFMDGVTNRLAHLDSSVVNLGIALGQRISSTNLGVSLTDDPFIRKLYFEVLSWEPQSTEYTPQKDDDDVEILPKAIEPPYFLADAIEYIVSEDDWRKHQLALQHLPQSLKKCSKLELQDHGQRLFRNLVFWQDRFQLADFDNQHIALLSLCMQREHELKLSSFPKMLANFVHSQEINIGRRLQLLQSAIQTVQAIETEKSRFVALLLPELLKKQIITELVLEKLLLTSGILLSLIQKSFVAAELAHKHLTYIQPHLGSTIYGIRRTILVSCNLCLSISLPIQIWLPLVHSINTNLVVEKDPELKAIMLDTSQQLLCKYPFLL